MSRVGPSWRREFASPLQVLQTELNRLFDECYQPGRYNAGRTAPVDLEASEWTPPLDVAEMPDSFLVFVEVPGVEPANIDLSVTGNVLSIKGAKPLEASEPNATVPLRERRFGVFHRQVSLSSEVDFEATSAEVRNGVLKIRLPKRQAAKSRTIPIRPS